MSLRNFFVLFCFEFWQKSEELLFAFYLKSEQTALFDRLIVAHALSEFASLYDCPFWLFLFYFFDFGIYNGCNYLVYLENLSAHVNAIQLKDSASWYYIVHDSDIWDVHRIDFGPDKQTSFSNWFLGGNRQRHDISTFTHAKGSPFCIISYISDMHRVIELLESKRRSRYVIKVEYSSQQ